MTKKKLLAKIQLLQPISEEQRNAVVCSLIGHSKIQESFLGEFTCARCGAKVGDSLAGSYDSTNVVIVGHNCKTCQANYKRLTWKDKLFCPDPF